MAEKKLNLDEMRDEALRKQDNLAADIDELLDRINPKNALARWKNELTDSAKSFTGNKTGAAKSFFVADDGAIKPLPAASVVGGAVGVLALVVGMAVLATRTPKDGE